MGRNILKSSIENASFSIIFQILFRIITFVLNAFIIRHVGQTVLGIMNVRLLLLESTILFLSKEPNIKACLTDTKSHNWAQVINQIWLTVPFTAVVALFFVYIWTNILSSTDSIYQTQYYLGCYAIAISCVIDQISQSLVIVAQSYCFVRLKVVIDTVYIIIRTVIFVVLVLRYPNSPLNAFSLAQLFSSLAFTLLYYGFFYWYIKKLNVYKKENGKKEVTSDDEEEDIKEKDNCLISNCNNENKGNPENNKLEAKTFLDGKSLIEEENLIDSRIKKDLPKSALFNDMHDFPFTSILDFFPGFMENWEKPLNPSLCILAVSFFKQCIVKQILTEGERYVMTISPVLTFSQQSMYDIVNNLGSLAARFLFRPIEESAYFYFTQMVKRDVAISEQQKKNINEATTVLNQLCKVVISIGLIVIAFGQSYSYTLLHLYGGKALTDNALPTTLLRFHCVSVLLLAVNGVTECYVFATMNNQQIDRYNYKMVVFSVIFLIISYLFTLIFGPVGFILANCINMAARIGHSIYFIHQKYKDSEYRPLIGLIPDLYFVISLILVGILTKASELYLLQKSILLHITIGGICFIFVAFVWAYENKDLVSIGMNKLVRKKHNKVE
ncbi:protein RFT1 homolog [Agrilus planipennis]|uniref:Protein RFT1 homolog n=1 Tax=Agrilus planipennis TaxID=224129 RepID=A0A1W4WRG6_AGRPL|nr:protein RFT1 homolog [Agrilus planipennis]